MLGYAEKVHVVSDADADDFEVIRRNFRRGLISWREMIKCIKDVARMSDDVADMIACGENPAKIVWVYDDGLVYCTTR